MSGSCIGSLRKRLPPSALCAAVLILFVVVSASPARAQTAEALVDVALRIGRLEASLSALQGSAATAADVARLKDELESVKSAAQKAAASVKPAPPEPARTAPPEAWTALQWVGIAFSVGWAVVACFRERTRWTEMATKATTAPHEQETARVKAALEAARVDPTVFQRIDGVQKRIDQLSDTLNDVCDSVRNRI
jgi:hypothetical protein